MQLPVYCSLIWLPRYVGHLLSQWKEGYFYTTLLTGICSIFRCVCVCLYVCFFLMIVVYLWFSLPMLKLQQSAVEKSSFSYRMRAGWKDVGGSSEHRPTREQSSVMKKAEGAKKKKKKDNEVD